ncbi:hypothetical protein FQN50_005004 [Emmonsiellopsis sp. PD_5]|nr:hypothetical protein FQN50_005004 [Emmonsiellopsis sp. PD_5]
MPPDQTRHTDADIPATPDDQRSNMDTQKTVSVEAKSSTGSLADVEASGDSISSDASPGGASDQESPAKADTMSKSKIALIMTALCLAVFLAALDMTIITTALPTIAARFNTSQGDYAWIGSAYILAAASSTPSWGKISDIFGRKPVLLIANVIFFVGSLICGLSISIKMLLAGRAVQGIGGGGLICLSNICIGDLFSMRTRSLYYGMIGGVWAVAGALGPVIGGVFTQYVSWLPIDGVAFIIILFFLKIETPKTPFLAGLRAIDWLGSITVVCGTVMFLLGLEYGGVSYPWASATVICLLLFGVVTWGVFIVIQWRFSNYPIMPMWLFKRRSVVAAYGAALFHGFVFISDSFFLPLYMQAVIEATPLLSGVYLFPSVLAIAVGSAAAGIIIRKSGQYLPVIWLAMTIMVLGHGLYIDLPSQKNWPRIILYQIVAGLGIGPNFQAPLIALQSHIKPSDLATATATFGFLRNLASSISVVVGGVIFQNCLKLSVKDLTTELPPRLIQQLGSTSAGASTAIVAALPDDQKEVVLDAYAHALKYMWVFYTVMSAFGLVVSLLIRPQTLRKDHEVTKTGLDVQMKQRAERLQKEKEEKAEKAEKAEKEAELKETKG